MNIGGTEPGRSLPGATRLMNLTFYASQPMPDRVHITTVDRICALSVEISTDKSSDIGNPFIGMQYALSCPWEEITSFCAAQEGFLRLQLKFESHDHLVQFIEAQRTALIKLDGRVSLFYTKGDRTRAVDFKTLADLRGGMFHSPRNDSNTA